MKYNQYGYLQTDFDQMIKELESINFLPDNWKENSFSDLLATLVENSVAEAKTYGAKEAKLAEFAVSENETLKDFLAKDPASISRNSFYNIALQLLGYHVEYDYDLKDPLARMKANALPYTEKEEIDRDELIKVFYRLLNTRAKNGQTFIDNYGW